MEGKKRYLEERRIREGTRGKRENREPESSKGRKRDSPLIFYLISMGDSGLKTRHLFIMS